MRSSLLFKNVFLCFQLVLYISCKEVDASTVNVIMETNYGEIEMELYRDKAPEGVKNFLSYVKSDFYSGTIFHRVIPNFMIQGGGFDQELSKKETKAPIVNEATNGLKNETGTLAYARTNIVNSATSQFFINLKDNNHLNHSGKTPTGFGYAVFGKVTKGMTVVNRIAKAKTGSMKGYQDVPLKPIIIKKVKIKK